MWIINFSRYFVPTFDRDHLEKASDSVHFETASNELFN